MRGNTYERRRGGILRGWESHQNAVWLVKREKEKGNWAGSIWDCSAVVKKVQQGFRGSSRVKVAYHSSSVSPRNGRAYSILANCSVIGCERHIESMNVEISFKAQQLGPWVSYAFCSEICKGHIIMVATYPKVCVVFARWLIIVYRTGASNDKAINSSQTKTQKCCNLQSISNCTLVSVLQYYLSVLVSKALLLI